MENIVSNGIVDASKDLLCVFAIAFVRKGQNLARNRSKMLQRQASAVDSVANKTKLKNAKVQSKGWQVSP